MKAKEFSESAWLAELYKAEPERGSSGYLSKREIMARKGMSEHAVMEELHRLNQLGRVKAQEEKRLGMDGKWHKTTCYMVTPEKA